MLVQAVIVGLAGWRLAMFLNWERGPFAVFERVRALFGIRPGVEVTNEVGRILRCMYCLTVWTAALMWGLWYLSPWIPTVVAAMAIGPIAESWVRR